MDGVLTSDGQLNYDIRRRNVPMESEHSNNSKAAGQMVGIPKMGMHAICILEHHPELKPMEFSFLHVKTMG